MSRGEASRKPRLHGPAPAVVAASCSAAPSSSRLSAWASAPRTAAKRLGMWPFSDSTIRGNHQLAVGRLVGREGLERAKIGWGCDQDAVPGRDEQLAKKLESLLRSAGDENIVGGAIDALAAHMAGDPGAKLEVALADGILQRSLGLCLILENSDVGFLDPLTRKKVRVRDPAGKGNHAWPLDDLQEFSNLGSLHALHALGVNRTPGGHDVISTPHWAATGRSRIC